jgi:predicted DNA-binding transcriptional regulator AlpA
VTTLHARVLRRAVLDAAGLRGHERMLTTDEVSKRLGRSKSWIEKNLHVLPPRRALAGSPGWREADIDEWIRNTPKY